MPADLCATLRRCSRVDSATLNLRPDEVDSESAGAMAPSSELPGCLLGKACFLSGMSHILRCRQIHKVETGLACLPVC